MWPAMSAMSACHVACPVRIPCVIIELHRAAPFPCRIWFSHKSKLSLITLICFNDPNSPSKSQAAPGSALESVMGIYYKLISYFISGFVSAASEIMKKLFYGHIRFLRCRWAAADTENINRRAADGPARVLVCPGHFPATSHWARSDILNLMEIDERLLWYEIALCQLHQLRFVLTQITEEGVFFIAMPFPPVAKGQSVCFVFLVLFLFAFCFSFCFSICSLGPLLFFIIKVISADGRTKFIDSISSPALALSRINMDIIFQYLRQMKVNHDATLTTPHRDYGQEAHQKFFRWRCISTARTSAYQAGLSLAYPSNAIHVEEAINK